MSKYKVLVSCEVDEENYLPGDVIPGSKLTNELIEHWIKKGVIESVTESKSKKSKAKTKQKEV